MKIENIALIIACILGMISSIISIIITIRNKKETDLELKLIESEQIIVELESIIKNQDEQINFLNTLIDYEKQ